MRGCWPQSRHAHLPRVPGRWVLRSPRWPWGPGVGLSPGGWLASPPEEACAPAQALFVDVGVVGCGWVCVVGMGCGCWFPVWQGGTRGYAVEEGWPLAPLSLNFPVGPHFLVLATGHPVRALAGRPPPRSLGWRSRGRDDRVCGLGCVGWVWRGWPPRGWLGLPLVPAQVLGFGLVRPTWLLWCARGQIPGGPSFATAPGPMGPRPQL